MSTNEQELLLTRGIPGSGKSTWARRWVMEDPENRVRVNRDDIREELYGKEYHGNQTPENENRVTSYEHNRIKAALSNGKSVVSDNMHLNPRFTRDFYKMAKEAGVPIRNKDFPISLDEALRRNAARDRVVPADVIRKIYSQNLGPNGEFHHFDGSYAVKPFVKPLVRRQGVIFDMDGTLTNVSHVRHFVRGKYRNFDMFHRSSVFCPPNQEVVDMAFDTHDKNLAVIIVTARSEPYREVTQKWLDERNIPYENIYMRPEGDQRQDAIVKAEILQDILVDYDVVHCVDDNVNVKKVWAEAGIRTTVVPGFDDEEPGDHYPIMNPFRVGKCLRCGRSLSTEGPLGPECSKLY